MVLEIIGSLLIVGILIFGWFDYRRNMKIPNIGVAMVKNRLNGSHQSEPVHRA